MHPDHIAPLTPHEDINQLLADLTEGIGAILADRLVGLYLTGSLTYGDFDRGSSDIDYLAVLDRPITPDARKRLKTLHAQIAGTFPAWAERIEGSYVTRGMLGSIEPPATPRPYVNGGAFWDPDPPYGNEWLVNLYALRDCGVALVGPEPERVFPLVSVEDVRAASRRDLVEEWVPKVEDRTFFESSHHQAYVTLTLCRILHRAHSDEVVSKRVAASWVRKRYPEPWIADLIDRAVRWEHGQELDEADGARSFIAFVRDRVPA
jgi:hypothetical protein